MKKKPRRFYGLISLSLLFSLLAPVLVQGQEKLQTVAESSEFKSTSKYADVMDFIRSLQGRSDLIRMEIMCTSAEGREVPLLIIGNPPPSSPKDLIHDSRAVVYIQGNIHAGEVEGKEASLMLARDIVLDKNLPYLDRLVILISPIFNADGNEQMGPDNRRGQEGPELVGVRYNGQNLDLNRDSMKLESPELQGLVENVLNRWDPSLLVDLHTTNGSYHEHPVTYSWPLNPNGDHSIIIYMRDKMMPWIAANLEDRYETISVPYGNFRSSADPSQGWYTFSHQPRFVTNYVGLRNRLSILDENYSHADFETRVKGCYNFLRSILDYCSDNTEEILSLIAEADITTMQRGLHPTQEAAFGMNITPQELDKPVTIRGFEMEVIESEGARPRVQRTDTKKTYTVPYFADFVPEKKIPLPYAYLIPLNDQDIEGILIQHGIMVERLVEAVTLEVETFRITEIKAAERLYQGHYMNSATGEYAVEEREFPAGTLCVGMAQPLANLAAYLLEGESDDGLLVWNFFDRYLAAQWGRGSGIYPVYRLLRPVNLVKDIIR